MNMAYALPWSYWGNDSTGGTSTCSSLLKEMTGSVVKNFRKSQSLSDGRDNVLDEIMAEARTCATPGWDGYGADAVNPLSVRYARAFVEALPKGTVMPSVGAEPDGQITLEWYHNPGWVLSVSVSPEGTLYYAAMLGAARARGSEPFLGRVPESLLQIVRRLPKK